MPAVLPDEGEVQMLAIALGIEAPETLSLRLFVNDTTPGLADVTADYVEMSGHGYAAKALAAGVWTLTAADAGTNTPAKASAPAQHFVFTAAGAPADVYGAFLVGLDSGSLWGAQRFPDAPYHIENEGDAIEVTPTVRLRSGYP
jgi:hypothetical protein